MSGISFLDFEGSDPVAEQRRAGQAIAKTKHELDRRGFRAFIMHASSVEELRQRMILSEVDAAVDDVVRQHMNFVSDAKNKIGKAFEREWIAANSCNCGPGCTCVKGQCVCPSSKQATEKNDMEYHKHGTTQKENE